jgi:leucyl aminopeptidase (aminopeptidase T)
MGDSDAMRLGELGIGTNPMARAIDHVENKFRLGTAHIALGDNHLIGWRASKKYGGEIKSALHIDLVAGNVAVEIDGRPAVRDGKIILSP